MTVETNWYVLYVGDQRRIKAINTVFSNLGKKFTLWIPQQRNPIYKGVRSGSEFRPLYPGYVFLNFEDSGESVEDQLRESQIGFFLRKPGDERPVKLTDEDISSIKDLEAQHITDTFLPQLLNFKVHDTVEITNGPFIGTTGLVLDIKKNKALVEITIFGRVVSAEVDVQVCTLKI